MRLEAEKSFCFLMTKFSFIRLSFTWSLPECNKLLMRPKQKQKQTNKKKNPNKQKKKAPEHKNERKRDEEGGGGGGGGGEKGD